MSDNKKQDSAYALLKGHQKAMPVILMAIAVFVGLCYITKGTGFIGYAISNVFLGLFSIGAYFIPFLIALHSVFYASDIKNKRLSSRIFFSVALVLTVSTLAHVFTFLGADVVFNIKSFYSDGIQSRGGGFFGGLIAFCLTKLFGKWGLIIIGIVLFSIYAIYFFSKEGSIALSFIKGIGKSFKRFFKNIGNSSKERKIRKEKKKLDETIEKQNELFRDEFFAADNGMKELKIPEFGIEEIRDDKSIESNPKLQSSVHPKSEFNSYDTPKRRSMDYGEPPKEKEKYKSTDIIYQEDAEEKANERSKYGLDESADEVFSKNFASFDLKMNEQLASKPSSKAPIQEKPKEEANVGITEICEPANRITEEEIERARKRADFEMKKKSAIAAQEAYRNAAQKLPNEEVFEFGKALGTEDVKADEAAPKTISAEPSTESTQKKPFENPYETSIGTPSQESAAQDKTEENATNTGEYTDSYEKSDEASENDEAVSSDQSISQSDEPTLDDRRADNSAFDKYRRAAEFASVITASHSESVSSEKRTAGTQNMSYSSNTPLFEQKFEPQKETVTTAKGEDSAIDYNPTVIEEPKTDYENANQASNSIRVTRTILEPTPTLTIYEENDEDRNLNSSDSSENDSAQIFDNKNEEDESSESKSEEFGGEVFVFDDKDDEDESDSDALDYAPDKEDADNPFGEEIPENEQNEDVKEFRKLFSFLEPNEKDADDEEKKDDFATDSNDEDEDDELPEDGIAKDDDLDSEDSSDEEDDKPPFAFAAFAKPEKKAEEKPKEEPKPKPDYSDYKLPPIDLLKPGKNEEDPLQNEECNQNAEKLIDTLSQFGVRASIKGFSRGPRITRYEIVPARGVKVNTITNLFDDIALNMAAEGIRMEAPIPGKAAIGVEIPNKNPSLVLLRDLVESEEFTFAESKTAACIGKDVTGNPVIGDIAKMPHVLIAGATGMGKSVCINAVLISILYKARPDEVKLIMIDPKKVEFNGYDGIPHLLIPVVTDVKQAAGALMWAVEQMEKRYDIMKQFDVRKLDSYNDKVRENPELGEPLPKIVIVIDELSDIMLQARKPVEDLIMSIAQKARAAGIHLIIGTQRPSVDVITGVIKANIPSRISCKVASFNDSKTIIEQAGAEKLLNNGDMLYVPAGAPKALRVQGAFVSDGEVSAVMKYLKSQVKGSVYDEQALEDINRAAQKCVKGGKGSSSDDFDDDDDGDENCGIFNDQQFLDAVELATKQGKISTSLLQRKIGIGYGKAAKYIDIMEEQGIVSEPNGQKPRDVLITRDEWHELLSRRNLD